MGAYNYINKIWRAKDSDSMRYLLRIRTWEYRQNAAICKLHRPSRPEKARRVGFKAKKGIVVYRVRIKRGGRGKRNHRGIVNGKPSNHGTYRYKWRASLRARAERKVGEKLTSLRDGKHKYFEVILVDPMLQSIRDDPTISWIVSTKHKRREARGLTAAGKKHRAIKRGSKYTLSKGGSRRRNWKRKNTLSLKRYR